MVDRSNLAPWIRRFLLEHLVGERNFSKNTQQSYRDTLCVLLPFIGVGCKRIVDRLRVEDLTSEILRAFLTHVEKERHCSVSTRNQRLAAIHALARFIGERSPEHLHWCEQIRSVPFKRAGKSPLSYLDKAELDALLAAADVRTEQGRRDYALLLFLYNSGARVSEATQVTIGDLELLPGGAGLVKLHGKGNKSRICPLWKSTMSEILPLTSGRSPAEHVFLNRLGAPITRFGVHTLVERHAKKAAEKVPSLSKKRVSPHTIRHYVARRTMSRDEGCDSGSIWNCR